MLIEKHDRKFRTWFDSGKLNFSRVRELFREPIFSAKQGLNVQLLVDLNWPTQMEGNLFLFCLFATQHFSQQFFDVRKKASLKQKDILRIYLTLHGTLAVASHKHFSNQFIFQFPETYLSMLLNITLKLFSRFHIKLIGLCWWLCHFGTQISGLPLKLNYSFMIPCNFSPELNCT